MQGDISTSLDDWFAVLEQQRVRLTRSDRIMLDAMALSEGLSPAEIIRQSVRERFLSKWPFRTTSHDS